MVKNLFQDMVKVNSSRREQPTRITQNQVAKEKFSEEKEKPPIENNYDYSADQQDNSKPRYRLWFVAFIAVIILFFALSFLFSKAHITIDPKSLEISVSENLSAVKNGDDTILSFDLVSISGEETKIIQGGEEREVKEPAKGTVVIYNTFSTASQSLDINTRLEGSNGKMYKTDVKIVVPGMKGTTPGSVEVGIYAAEPGIEYNSEPLDFKIFGFKGGPKYNKFYARSKGDITGGLTGKFHTISEEEKVKATAELKTALQAKLLKKATDQIPDGFVLFKDAVFLKIDDEVTSTTSNQSQVPVTLRGTFYGFLFDEQKLTEELVKKVVPNYDGSPVHISNIKDLNFSLANKETISFKDATSIYFKISGNSNIVWDVDVVKLAKDVQGKKKNDFSEILLNYPNIDSADLTILPVWKNSFPEQLKDIKISIGELN